MNDVDEGRQVNGWSASVLGAMTMTTSHWLTSYHVIRQSDVCHLMADENCAKSDCESVIMLGAEVGRYTARTKTASATCVFSKAVRCIEIGWSSILTSFEASPWRMRISMADRDRRQGRNPFLQDWSDKDPGWSFSQVLVTRLLGLRWTWPSAACSLVDPIRQCCAVRIAWTGFARSSLASFGPRCCTQYGPWERWWFWFPVDQFYLDPGPRGDLQVKMVNLLNGTTMNETHH